MATHSFPALGFNPAPGEPTILRQVAHQLTSTANDLDHDAALLHRIQHTPIWQGDAAEAFATQAQTLIGDLQQAAHAYGSAGQALRTYATALATAQAHARHAEQEAAAATRRAATLGRAAADATGDEQAAFQHRQGLAHDAYEAALARARQLQSEIKAAASLAARQVRAASDAPYHRPSLFEQASRWATGKLAQAGAAIDRWVDEHADLLRQISSTLKIISAVAGVLSFIPALTPIAAPIAAATGGAALALDATLAATGNGDWKAVAVDAGLMLLPGAGRIASRAIMSRQATQIVARLADEALPVANRLRSNTIAALRTRNLGTRMFAGGSKARLPEGAVHPRLREALDRVPLAERSRYHGRCAEMKALNEALHSGARLNDAVVQTRYVRRPTSIDADLHNMPQRPCTSCLHVLKNFAIRYME